MVYKYLFDDYSEGMRPRILEAFGRTNMQQEPGYVLDAFATEAAELIQVKIGSPEAEVHFVSSGTHANLSIIAALLTLRQCAASLADESHNAATR